MASLPPERRQTDPPHGYKQTPHGSRFRRLRNRDRRRRASFCKCVSVEAPARAAHSGTLSITRGLLYARGGGPSLQSPVFFLGTFSVFGAFGPIGKPASERLSGGGRLSSCSDGVSTKGVRAAVHTVREKGEESNDLLSPDSRAFSLYLVSKFGLLRSTIRALSTIAVRLQQPVDCEP